MQIDGNESTNTLRDKEKEIEEERIESGKMEYFGQEKNTVVHTEENNITATQQQHI